MTSNRQRGSGESDVRRIDKDLNIPTAPTTRDAPATMLATLIRDFESLRKFMVGKEIQERRDTGGASYISNT